MVTYWIRKVYLFAVENKAVVSAKLLVKHERFDKKLGRDHSLVVVVHHYLQQLSPMCAPHVCTSDKRVEADCRLTALEH